MNQAIPEPYVIQGSLPDRYPRGWFCIGTDYEFTSIPTKLDYFGTSLVARARPACQCRRIHRETATL